MASGLSQSLHHQFRCFFYSTNPSRKCSVLTQNPSCSARLRTIPESMKSSPRKSPSTPLEASSQEPMAPVSNNRVKSPDPSSSSGSSPLNLPSLLRERIKIDGLGLEVLSIALPAALSLAADPVVSLVDTAFVGHLGPVELAAVGVSATVFNLVSKLFNVPLLNITTSFVAEEQALFAKSNDESNQIDQDCVADHPSKILLPSVSTSLALAAGLGIAEAVALSIGSGFLMNTMGIPVVRVHS